MAGDGRSGTFITFEGGEGSGKSTVAERAAAWLREQGHDVLLTREPEGTELGRHMWAFFKSPATAGKTMTAEAELFLFAAARAEHVRTVIAPALESGRIVLCDRFADSTTAYQGYGRGVELSTVEATNVAACDGLSPDLTLVLDMPAEEGLRRARALEADEAKRPDSIGSESGAFHDRVREGFLAIARAQPGRVTVVDASASLDDVEAAVIGAIERLLASRK
ncbi:MAG: dTMP kinase [Chloroflexi bacterium]|nr:dTMP kinase [Chloroflexota bacterium]MCI0784010.1 dTMP kinase [Chloroflexota bacterium]MCI0815392.1 dTMP kinase [Chloroflexota bacterium]MCI0816828.1 dTMP kinase [Chloroflexota bacterium]MCI0819071.1 dTMP kinase [Chloroflexota bacterium]